ncbi:MAG: flavodoxin [Firmicutes bacterium]|nr:flavodoxin [Bacillota bacterium]
MKKAIVIYSKTGNTLGVAKRLSEKMNVEVMEIKVKDDNPNIMEPTLTYIPDISNYDHLIFASPVHGFNLSKVMQVYLKQLPDLENKTADLYITHFFPFAWMGGNRTLKQMKNILESKHCKVNRLTSINWKSKRRESVIQTMIENYSM